MRHQEAREGMGGKVAMMAGFKVTVDRDDGIQFTSELSAESEGVLMQQLLLLLGKLQGKLFDGYGRA